jgi:hypothetical protein
LQTDVAIFGEIAVRKSVSSEKTVDAKGPPIRDSVVMNEETEGGSRLCRRSEWGIGPRESGCGPRRWFR